MFKPTLYGFDSHGNYFVEFDSDQDVLLFEFQFSEPQQAPVDRNAPPTSKLTVDAVRPPNSQGHWHGTQVVEGFPELPTGGFWRMWTLTVNGEQVSFNNVPATSPKLQIPVVQ